MVSLGLETRLRPCSVPPAFCMRAAASARGAPGKAGSKPSPSLAQLPPAWQLVMHQVHLQSCQSAPRRKQGGEDVSAILRTTPRWDSWIVSYVLGSILAPEIPKDFFISMGKGLIHSARDNSCLHEPKYHSSGSTGKTVGRHVTPPLYLGEGVGEF